MYKIRYEEVLSIEIPIEAENEYEARLAMFDKVEEEEIILDYTDLEYSTISLAGESLRILTEYLVKTIKSAELEDEEELNYVLDKLDKIYGIQ